MSSGSLSEVLDSHRVVVCVGSGGVGKTTTSAALAVEAAVRGRRTLCLTIDPARRLANSLGLSEMESSEQIVPSELFAQHGLQLGGSLSAMMLDTKRTFDELVEKYATSPERRERILRNRLYQYVSGSLAGTQEYMAMEKLHAVRQRGEWDLIVLDTPPTSNALDFLDAPERLVDAIDSGAMRWFIQAFQSGGGFSLDLVSRSAAFLMKGLARFTGAEFLAEVSGFVSGLNDLFGGFRERAAAVASALRSSEVAFVIVTSPNPLAIREALFFNNRLRDAGMPSQAFVINAVHPYLSAPTATSAALTEELVPLLPPGWDAARTYRRLARALEDEHSRGEADRTQTTLLRSQIPEGASIVEVPAFEEDVHDLAALWQVAGYLMGRFNPHALG